MEAKSTAVKSSVAGTWNVRSMNQGKLEAVKQEMASISVDNFRNQRTKMDWNG